MSSLIFSSTKDTKHVMLKMCLSRFFFLDALSVNSYLLLKSIYIYIYIYIQCFPHIDEIMAHRHILFSAAIVSIKKLIIKRQTQHICVTWFELNPAVCIKGSCVCKGPILHPAQLTFYIKACIVAILQLVQS